MVNRIIFWTGFGLLTRAWQLGIEMRPFYTKNALLGFPIFAGVGASFGYWLQGIDEKQTAVLAERKAAIYEKRARRAAQTGEPAGAEA
ncbi:hypothetical protein B0H67DRAFT_485422 [Lasiosphaeris hirsuta]|uniref:Uncharacterized protein n=1 Tax=Lasiosphaeris hirsuta TaxID=260670 RepID=A0AA40AR39_9PEZI|nr:hypothetical protein B0H67DRAFT_485422 [Lasiosphaeris hirsuta]